MLPGIGPVVGRRLFSVFGDATGIFAASEKDLRQVGGLTKRTIAQILEGGAREEAETTIRLCRQQGISIVPNFCDSYPELLSQCPDPPLQLYVKGDASLLKENCLAIVGARAASSYGTAMASRFSGELAAHGFTVVSGMALGIDTAAHLGCLDAGGKTIAVLGCGLDVIYPHQNRDLFLRIARQGAIVSEYPLGTKPESFRFPARNRIISGLCLGVLVVEAAKHSGSLITAQLALEHNREVFAMPGRIDSFKSMGTHKILQQGAKLVFAIEDILEELPLAKTIGDRPAFTRLGTLSPPALDENSKRVFELLEVYPIDINSIIRGSGLTAQQVSESLLLLEMSGLVETIPGKQFRRVT